MNKCTYYRDSHDNSQILIQDQEKSQEVQQQFLQLNKDPRFEYHADAILRPTQADNNPNMSANINATAYDSNLRNSNSVPVLDQRISDVYRNTTNGKNKINI